MNTLEDRSFLFSRCAACSYDLRGKRAESERCPECGQDLQLPAITAVREQRFFSALRRTLVIYFTIALIIAAILFVALRESAVLWTPLMVLLAPALVLTLAILCARRLPE